MGGGGGSLGSKLLSGKANFGDAVRIGLAGATAGTSELGYAGKRTVAGMATPGKTIADNLQKTQELQSQQAARMEQQLAQRPQNVSPDNFLANKAKMLQNMRLGLASTISGAGGNPAAPTLSSPSLTGKRTLGS